MALFEAAEKFGINSKEAIRCSQELDNLLNQRMQRMITACMRKKERPPHVMTSDCKLRLMPASFLLHFIIR
ncbi:aspartyl-phosphate phosphatase Spo0E family protein [Bacillus licheniformis]|nr:aspartyl-phosphate phosphatase Spo0E family protein [Bacillus licheniformis]